MEDMANNREEETWGDRPQRLVRKWFLLPALLGALIFLVGITAWQFSAPGEFKAQFNALDDIDLEQTRLDTALPAPRGDLVIAQSFVPRHDGLEAIELMLAQYGSPEEIDNGLLTMRIFGPDGELIAEEIVETRKYDQNQVFRFSFPPQQSSRSRTYTLKISGNAENNWSVWGYSLEVHEDGQLTLEATPGTADPVTTSARELRFTTRYHLTLREALNAIGQALYFEGLLFLLALATLPLPGCIALILFGRRQRAKPASAEDSRTSWPWDPAAWWGVALGLGVAIWPLLWLWLSLINGRWRGWSLWLVLLGGWAAVFWLWWQDNKARRRRIDLADTLGNLPSHPPPTLAWNKAHLLLLLILLAGFAVRLLAVRDVVFPPWVDSSRHALITMIMTNSGQVIADYQPYLPVDHFPYHYGFHTLSSSLALISGWPLPRLLLYLGQLLNALVPLAIYAALWLLTRRKGVGLIGAFLVAIPFFFPAYYATWGRFTQLTAVLLLPLAIALAWQLVRGEPFWQQVWWMLAILVSGLFLTHFRVFLYFLPFVLLIWLISLGRRTRPLAAAVGLGLLLILPRLVQLLLATDPARQIGQTIPNYNAFPSSYFNTGWEQGMVYAAAAGLLIVLVAAVRRQSWAWLPLALVAWVVALFLLLSLERVGLPGTSLVNLNSMYIILFVPLALILAVVLGRIGLWLRGQHWLLQILGYSLAGALLAALSLYGLRQQIGILNAQTILAEAEDMPALDWAAINLPPESHLAVNSWRWLGQTWAAADGGAWLLPLTGLSTTTPPIDHIYNPDLFQEVRAFNETATAVNDWSDPAQAAWLREQGVTHIFVGKKGGYFDPARLLANPQLELIYGKRGVFVFAVGE